MKLMFTFLLIAIGFIWWSYETGVKLYLEGPNNHRSSLTCMYTNVCMKALAAGEYGGMKVTAMGNPSIKNFFYDFELLKNKVYVCERKNGERILSSSRLPPGCGPQ